MTLEEFRRYGEQIKIARGRLGPMQTKDFRDHRKLYPFYGYAEVKTEYCDPFLLFCNNDEVFSYYANWNGLFEYEKETLRLWANLARRAKHVVDIGAHVGVFSLVAFKSNNHLSIDAFEAVDHIFCRLSVNIQANRVPRIRPHLLAVSDSIGWTDINLRAGPSLMSTGASITDRGKTVATKRVPMSTLDAVLSDAVVDLIKIDVEEHEPQVLRGASQLLERNMPLILSEVLSQNGLEALLSILSPLGYKAYWLSENTGMLISELADRPPASRNIVFAHPKGPIQL